MTFGHPPISFGRSCDGLASTPVPARLAAHARACYAANPIAWWFGYTGARLLSTSSGGSVRGSRAVRKREARWRARNGRGVGSRSGTLHAVTSGLSTKPVRRWVRRATARVGLMTPTNLEPHQNGRYTTRRSGKPPKPADRNDRGEVSSVVARAWSDGVANRPIGKAIRGRAAPR